MTITIEIYVKENPIDLLEKPSKKELIKKIEDWVKKMNEDEEDERRSSLSWIHGDQRDRYRRRRNDRLLERNLKMTDQEKYEKAYDLMSEAHNLLLTIDDPKSLVKTRPCLQSLGEDLAAKTEEIQQESGGVL